MIDARDLRIGNNLLFRNKIIEVAVINSDNTIRFWNSDKTDTVGCFKTNEFNPIPLTEEILLKCDTGDCGLTLKYNNARQCYAVYYIDTLLTFVTYLHEWQNLYYCLTGQELNVNL